MQDPQDIEVVGDHNYVALLSPSNNDDDEVQISDREEPEEFLQRRPRTRRMRLQLRLSDGGTDHDYVGGGPRRRRRPPAEHEDPSVEQEDSVAVVANSPTSPSAEINLPANDDPDNSNSGFGPPVQPVNPIEVATTSASAHEAQAEGQNNNAADGGASSMESIDLISPPVQPKKRKRMSKVSTPRVKSTPKAGVAADGEEEDEGLVCPICLDHWEMSGEHRLVSLRCGHLFGDTCIRRWLSESAKQSGVKACPQCKAKATNKDIRFLYAKRLRAIDRSEEHQLREELDEERRRTKTLQGELTTMKLSYALATARIQTLEVDNDRVKQLLRWRDGAGAAAGMGYTSDSSLEALQRLKYYKLALERTIEVTREPGCRVMVYGDLIAAMVVSQKSSQSLFPGYGLRFIDTPTFRPTNFLHASAKLVRDVCLNGDQRMVAVASMEPRSKLFDMRVPSAVALFVPSDKALWSCAMDRAEREHFLYLGAQHGSTYVYDLRNPDHLLDEFKTEGDLSPVINVAAVPANKHFASGGFVVCKLQSLWFYEYTAASNTAVATRLNVEGPFISMNFDEQQQTLLISVRNSSRFPQSRFLLGQLIKIDDIPAFEVRATFVGSRTTAVMTRASQIAVAENTLVAGYTQDAKMLALFDARRGTRTYSLPIQEVVFDTCPVYTPNLTYLAALTETKCRIYKLMDVSYLMS